MLMAFQSRESPEIRRNDDRFKMGAVITPHHDPGLGHRGLNEVRHFFGSHFGYSSGGKNGVRQTGSAGRRHRGGGLVRGHLNAYGTLTKARRADGRCRE